MSSIQRVTSMAYRDADTEDIKEAYIYTYDRNSNIVSERIVSNYVTDDTGQGTDITREYTYDALGRLTKSEERAEESASSKITEYTYDAEGNRLTESRAGEETSYTYNGLNQLTGAAVTGTEGENRTYEYDSNGNLIRESSDTGEYDEADRLSKLTVKEGEAVTLTQENRYNGEGMRIRKKETAASKAGGTPEETRTTDYFYQDGAVLYTKDEAGVLSGMNLLGTSGNIIETSREAGNSEAWYLYNKDIRESTTSIVGADGEAAAAYEYDEFGNTAVKTGEGFSNEICYTGQIYDKSTGLYYYNARFYNPQDGRFITQDTYRGENTEPDTLHLYAYCANNPINYTDPSGHAYAPTYHKRTIKYYVRGWGTIKTSINWWKSSKLNKVMSYNKPKVTAIIGNCFRPVNKKRAVTTPRGKYSKRVNFQSSIAVLNYGVPAPANEVKYIILDIVISVENKKNRVRCNKKFKNSKGYKQYKWGNF